MQLDASSRISKSIFSKMKRNMKKCYSFFSTYLIVISRKERVTFFYIALNFRENGLLNSSRCAQSRIGKRNLLKITGDLDVSGIRLGMIIRISCFLLYFQIIYKILLATNKKIQAAYHLL